MNDFIKGYPSSLRLARARAHAEMLDGAASAVRSPSCPHTINIGGVRVESRLLHMAIDDSLIRNVY